MRHLINTAIILLFGSFPATAQNKKPTQTQRLRRDPRPLRARRVQGRPVPLDETHRLRPQQNLPTHPQPARRERARHANIKNLLIWNEYLADEDLRRKHPAFVLAPQSNGRWLDNTSEVKLYPEPRLITIDDLPEGMRKFGP